MIWLQWTNRRRKTTAHAVNPDEDMLTGKRRCICGSLIPSHAIDYDGKAKRDPFCLKIIKDGPSKRRKAKLKRRQGKDHEDGLYEHGDGSTLICWKGKKNRVSKILPTGEYELRVTAKSIGVYQGGKRVFFARVTGWTPGKMRGTL